MATGVHLLYRRHRVDEVLDLFGRDLLCATVDQILVATFDHEIAAGVPPTHVAAAVEAVGCERAGVCSLAGNRRVACRARGSVGETTITVRHRSA
jgi:hypothetical protein